MEQIKAAAKLVVPRNKVYSDIDNSDTETVENSEDEELSDHDTSSKDKTDSDNKDSYKKSRKKKASKKKLSWHSSKDKAQSTDVVDKAVKKKDELDKEMEDLIHKLSTLHIDKPKYAAAYLITTERHLHITTIFPLLQTRYYANPITASRTHLFRA
jgi:hypothetical protein